MKKLFTKEVIIAVITLISMFVLYSGLNYLKGINIFKPTNHFYVVMPDVSELQNSSPIYLDGFKVGIVNSINYEYLENGQGQLVVMISLDKQMRLQTGSYVELKSGLTSGAYLNLQPNRYVSTYLQIGDTIDGFSNIGLMDKLSTDLLPQVEKILPRLDTILMGIQVLVNHPAINQSLNNLTTTTENLQKSSQQLNALLNRDIPSIVNNLDQISSDFTVVSGNLKEIDLNKTVQTMNQAMENIDQVTRQLNRSDNTLGLFLNDRSLYDQLDSTARNAAILLDDIKKQPKNYVRFSLF